MSIEPTTIGIVVSLLAAILSFFVVRSRSGGKVESPIKRPQREPSRLELPTPPSAPPTPTLESRIETHKDPREPSDDDVLDYLNKLGKRTDNR